MSVPLPPSAPGASDPDGTAGAVVPDLRQTALGADSILQRRFGPTASPASGNDTRPQGLPDQIMAEDIHVGRVGTAGELPPLVECDKLLAMAERQQAKGNYDTALTLYSKALELEAPTTRVTAGWFVCLFGQFPKPPLPPALLDRSRKLLRQLANEGEPKLAGELRRKLDRHCHPPPPPPRRWWWPW